MILDWFNAREAAALGGSLADSLMPAERSSGSRSTPLAAEAQRLLQRAVRESRPLKLNLFKRAKLLGAFKWRLVEQGFDQTQADELTRLLLLQLSGGQAIAAASAEPEFKALSRKRIAPLMAQAEAEIARGNLAGASERLQEVATIDPNHALAYLRLGVVLFKQDRFAAAEGALRRAIQLDSNAPDAHFFLGTVLRLRGDIAASETTLRRAIKQDPRNAEALVGLGHTLASLGRLKEANEYFDKAYRLQPRSPSVLCALGWAASMAGRFSEAEEFLRVAREVDPKCAEAWALITDLRRMTPADAEWATHAQQLLDGGLPRVEEARLRFAMGKYFDDVGEYAKAFAQYRQANEVQKPIAKPYDRGARESFVADMIRTYSRERLAQPLDGANDSDRPVFVTGMMRSGTSLVEQIIASHPRAVGAGELEYWNALVNRQHPELQRDPPSDARTAGQYANGYLKVLSQGAGDAARVVDKSTINSDLMGLIHLLLPRARFIYLRRDPVDTCLSCYFQNFVNVAAFTMDLKDLAHYYRGHHRLAAHWRSVLPEGTFLEVPYAELVADQEGWSRRIIEFIGLEWDPAVLEFHKTKRAVMTASNWQVRQKIYSSSLGRWQHYRKFIGPLLKLRDLPN